MPPERHAGVVRRRGHFSRGAALVIGGLVAAAISKRALAAEGASPRNNEGWAAVAATGEMALHAPDAGARPVGLGFGLEIFFRRAAWPVSLGFAYGQTTFGRASEGGPFVGYVQDGTLTLSTTDIVRSIELRRADLLVRLQPSIGKVRPFLQGGFGLAGLWETAELEGPDGEVLRREETQRSVSYLYAATAGLDIELARGDPSPGGTGSLLLTLGVRRAGTGQMNRIDFRANDGGAAVVRETKHEALNLWIPFASITVAFDSRMAARRGSRPASVVSVRKQ